MTTATLSKPNIINQLTDLACAQLILLFVYTGISKLIDLPTFHSQIHNQVFNDVIQDAIVWTLPAIEISVALLLTFKGTRLIGLWGATVLMLLFTGYIALVILHFFDRVPCSCGGVIRSLSWPAHLAFNLYFLLLSLLGIYMTYRERRRVGKE